MRNYVINNKEFRKKHSPLVKLSLFDKIESYEKESIDIYRKVNYYSNTVSFIHIYNERLWG